MKKIILVIILFIFAANIFAKSNRNLNVSIDIGESINKKYHRMLINSILYWVESKTIFRLSKKKKSHQLRVNVQQRLNQFVIEGAFRPVGGNSMDEIQAFSVFYKLTNYFDSLDKVFYKIFQGKIFQKTKTLTVIPDTFDIAFLLDSTGSMQEEIEFLQGHLRDILSGIFWNLKTDTVKLAFMDYKNTESVYRSKLANFQVNTAELRKQLNSIRAVGKGHGNLNHALSHLLRYGAWSAGNRFVFVFTDSAPGNWSQFNLLLQKAQKMKVRLVVLGGDGLPDRDVLQYKKVLKRYQGLIVNFSYTLSYLLKNKTMKRFIFHRNQVWKLEQGNHKVDLTLGRQVSNLKRIEAFLINEGIPVKELQNLEINLAPILEELTHLFRKKVPIARFRSRGKIIRVAIQDRKVYKMLLRLRRRKLVIGGHVFPFYNGISFFAHSVVIKRRKPPLPFIQPIQRMLKNPFFFHDKGIFEPSLWYIEAFFLGFEQGK